MTNQGSMYLRNEDLSSIYEQTSSYGTTIEDTFYEAYKNAYKLSNTNYFRGEAADAFKKYISLGAVNIITEFMDIINDITLLINTYAIAFNLYEIQSDGRVKEETLDSINTKLSGHKDVFTNSEEELCDVKNLAEKYITIQPLELNEVEDEYINLNAKIEEIRNNLYGVDSEACNEADRVINRISYLKTYITNLKSYCYDEDGNLNTDNLKYIDSQEWLMQAGNVALKLKLEEDPFVYVSGETTIDEGQWAAGLCSDVYIYAGYQLGAASGEAGIENGTYFARARYTGLQFSTYGQVTDYIRGQAEAKGNFVEGNAEIGPNGFRVEGAGGVAKAEGSIVVGSENVNFTVNGEAKLMCADATVACEFEDDGEYAVGFKAGATVAEAKVEGSFSLLSLHAEDDAHNKLDLLGFSGTVGVTEGAEAALWAENKKAIDTDYVDVYATSLEVNLGCVLDVSVKVTIPTVSIDLPW